MDLNYDIPGVKRNTTPEQREMVANIPDRLGVYDDDWEKESVLDELNDEDIIAITKNLARNTVPIYELKADEEARAKLKNHKEQNEYEELVAKVKEWEVLLADKTELDHKALAVLLDDKILFDELKRSHHVLDDTYAYITKETNKWEEHEAMYDALLTNIRDESDKCEEARQMLAKLM